ncbi:unnamed protein product [Allacma fusca]|uniref:SET domain-containing protein n=1 Tax=Allacma fusca TaxID=39272 RepID=A0A8J2NRE5_9HEXA|nr:unnamed protein product [Allacma fusca]
MDSEAEDEVNETSTTEIFLEKLFQCIGNADRISVVKEHFQWQPLLPELHERFKKNTGTSLKLLQIGDQFTKEKNFLVAMRAYNLASLFSLPEAPELEQASRKSTFLSESQLVKSLIKDPTPVRHYCLEESQNDEHLEAVNVNRPYYESIPNIQIKDRTEQNAALMEEIHRRGKYRQEMFTLKTVNPGLPGVHADVEVRVDPVRGRGLYAKCDIPIGTTLLVETPFVAGLAKALEWDVEHCHHCFKQLSHGIPCLDCVFTIYCNDLCRENAKEYHEYECPCLPELHLALKDEILSNFHLVFKLITVLGPTRLYNMFENKMLDQQGLLSTSQNSKEQLSDLVTDAYKQIHLLMSKIYPREGYYFVLMSLILTKILRERSEFFRGIPIQSQNAFEDFISEMILHNFETFRKNTFGLSQVPFEDRLKLVEIVKGSESMEKLEVSMNTFAAGILASGSLLNHSCDPNVIRVTGLRFCETAFVSLKKLNKNEELRISYGPTFGSIFKEARNRQRDLIYGKNFPYEGKATTEFFKFKLTKDFRCKVCGRRYCQDSFLKEVKKSQMVVEISKKLVLTNNPLACVESLKLSLDVLGDRLSHSLKHLCKAKVARNTQLEIDFLFYVKLQFQDHNLS